MSSRSHIYNLDNSHGLTFKFNIYINFFYVFFLEVRTFLGLNWVISGHFLKLRVGALVSWWPYFCGCGGFVFVGLLCFAGFFGVLILVGPRFYPFLLLQRLEFKSLYDFLVLESGIAWVLVLWFVFSIGWLGKALWEVVW